MKHGHFVVGLILLMQVAQQTTAASSYRFNVPQHADLSGIPAGRIAPDLNGSLSAPATTPMPASIPTSNPTAMSGPRQIVTLSDRISEHGSYPYSFAGNAGQIVTVTVHATGGLDPRVKLLGSDGAVLAENDDHEDADAALNSNDSRISDFRLPQTATYRLEIAGFAGTGGPFDLTLVIVTPPQVALPPTEAASAAHQEFAGMVNAGQTFDASLSLTAGEVYTLTAAGTSGDVDTMIEVRDPGGNVVVASDNHGSSDPTLSSTDARVDNWIVPVTETYTIRVSGARETAGDVLLLVDRTATGAPLGAGQDQVMTGEVQPNNLFTVPIEAQAGDYLTITVRTLSAGLDPHVALLDSAGTLLAENDDHSALDPALSDVDARLDNVRVPSSGMVTVQVSGYNAGGGSFALTVTTRR